MTAQQDPYSRVYWKFRREYPDIYQDDATLGTWLRLLITAEGAYPAPADLPRRIRKSCLDKLVSAGLVTLEPGDTFIVKGLTAERSRRSEAARIGGLASGRSRTPTTTVEPPLNERSTNGEPRRDETSRDKQSKDETSTPRPILVAVKSIDGSTTEVDVTEQQPSSDWLRLRKVVSELTGEPYPLPNPESGYGAMAMGDLERHGFDRVARAYWELARRMKAEGNSRPMVKQLVFGANDTLNPVPKADDKARAEEDAQAAFDRRVKRTREQYVEPYLDNAKEEKPA